MSTLIEALDAADRLAPLHDRLARSQAEATGDPRELARVRAERAVGEAARHGRRAGMGVDELARTLGRAWARAGDVGHG